ncbi:MAG: methyl-accepting chemotaxis protein [Gammaproteobacteria bacterium]|jgi:methyl-accepting chemotaxis protein
MLFYRFFFALLAISLIPASAYVYQLWQAQLRTQTSVERELVSTAKSIVSEVDHWVELNLRSSTLIGKTDEIQSMIATRQVPILAATDQTFEWSYTAFTTDLEGNAIARSDGKPLKFYGDREYVLTILNGGTIGQQVLISRVNGKPALCLSVPVSRAQRLVGVLVQCSKLFEISETVANVRIGNSGYARLIDSKRRLIAHGDTSQTTEELKDLTQDPITLLNASQKPVISIIDGKKIVTYTLATALDWRLTVVQDYDDAFAELEQSKLNAIIAGALLIVGIFLAAFLLGRNISRPIGQLAEVAETYSKGKLSMKIPGTTRRDEIGNLARAVERMGMGMKVLAKRYQAANAKNKQ